MDLKKLLGNKTHDEESREYFWAISIESGWVHSGVWYIDGEIAKLAFFGVPTRWETGEDLTTSIDTSLSTAIKDFPDGLVEPNKTVFGLNSEWIEGGEIKEDYLEKLKKICSDLTLNPIGFVVIPEAIAHYFKVKDNSPLNAILVGVYEKKLEITIFTMGKMLGTVNVSRSVSIIDDLSEGVVRFSVSSAIPSRILIYDGKEGELEETMQTLLKVSWEDVENVKFLHTPKIEIISPDTKVEAVTLAGASETAGVSQVSGLKKAERGEQLSGVVMTNDLLARAEDESIVDMQTRENREMTTKQIGESGFVIDEDISKLSTDKKMTENEDFMEATNELKEPITPISELESHDLHNLSSYEESSKNYSANPAKSFPKSSFFLKMQSIRSGLTGIFKKLPTFEKPQIGDRRTFSFGAIIFLLLLAVGFLLWWFMPKAEITIYVSPKTLTESEDLVLTTTEESDLETFRLKVELVENTESGEKTKSTTGTKVVGDKAMGEVLIYRVGPLLTLSSGTVLNGPNNLDFTLDESVSLASGSASTASVTKVKVTAANIGAQYNLASSTNFTVGNYSSADMEAKNETSFSGGSSREINAVSKEDQESLQEELKREISEDVLEKLKVNIASDKVIVEESLENEESNLTFSNKVGDEASTLKLSMNLKSSIMTLERSEILEVAKKILEGKIPDGFALRDDQLSFNFEKSGNNNYTLKVKSNLLPQVDIEKVRINIRGKYPSLAKDYFINELPGFVRAEIRISPPLPGRLGSLPKVAKNIEIQIASDK